MTYFIRPGLKKLVKAFILTTKVFNREHLALYFFVNNKILLSSLSKI